MNSVFPYLCLILVSTCASLLCACGNCSGALPVPVLNSVSPSSVSAANASGPLTLDLKGSAFDHTTQVWFNSSTQRPATFVSSTDIQVVLTAQEAQTPAIIDLSLYTPLNKDPESCSSGGFSNTVTFTVTP